MAGPLSRPSMNTVCVMIAAIQRETSSKNYARDWKINLIERDSSHWNDLHMALVSPGGVHGWPGQRPGHDETWVCGSAPPRLRVSFATLPWWSWDCR
jgi:hypothetical protein